MKLLFKKDENNQIRVFGIVDGIEKDFSYVEMIKSLIDTGTMEQPEIQEGFSEAEASSINRMVNLINSKVTNVTQEQQ